MSSSQTKFQQFLEEEVNRYKGIGYPVKSGILRRALIRRLPCYKIHPNPEDEFCIPKIGPNNEIISQYEKEIKNCKLHGDGPFIRDPLQVQRIHPRGYMLLNGHHRWAAAIRLSVWSLPVRIVNLTTAADLKKYARSIKNDRRVSIDLEEVIFTDKKSGSVEARLHFPLNYMFRERVRKGVPSLFHFLQEQGFDIWVYSSGYYSPDYIQRYFRHYGVKLTGVITGLVNTRSGIEEVRKEMAALTQEHYPETVHVDGQAVLCINRHVRKFEEYELSGSPDTWAREVINSIQAYEIKHKEKR